MWIIIFIDPDLPFLGARPDGLVDKDKVIEIKCPYSAREMTMTLKPRTKQTKEIHNGSKYL